MREVVAECDSPVMLYSIGKDSAVMLHLARQGVLPGAAAVPAAARRHHLEVPRHVRVPRRAWRSELGMELLVYVNPEGLAAGHQPVHPRLAAAHRRHEDRRRCSQALDQYGFDAAFGGARRDEEKSRAKERVFSFRSAAAPLGPEEAAPRALVAVQHAQAPRREPAGVPAVQLDRARRLAVHLARADPDRAAVLRRAAPGGRARRHADHGRRRAPAAAARRAAAAAEGALPHARLLSAHRRHRERRRHAAGDHRGDAADHAPPSGRAG